MLEVTQEDRDAYLALNMLPEFDAVDVRAGRWDGVTGVQAFAAHRQAAERAVVEWLRKENGLCDCNARSEGECGCGAWQDYKTKPLIDIADDIERGEHRK